MCYLCQLATESVVQIYSINRKICASQAIFFIQPAYLILLALLLTGHIWTQCELLENAFRHHLENYAETNLKRQFINANWKKLDNIGAEEIFWNISVSYKGQEK